MPSDLPKHWRGFTFDKSPGEATHLRQIIPPVAPTYALYIGHGRIRSEPIVAWGLFECDGAGLRFQYVAGILQDGCDSADASRPEKGWELLRYLSAAEHAELSSGGTLANLEPEFADDPIGEYGLA